jgi:hypothetical protein
MSEFAGLFVATVNQTDSDGKDSKQKDDSGELAFTAGTRLLYKTLCGIEINPNTTAFGMDGDTTDS